MADLRVGIDARPLNAPRLRGMGKYLLGVLSRGLVSGGASWILFGDRPDWPYFGPESDSLEVEIRGCRGWRFHAWEQWLLPRMARRWGVDVLHCTGNTLPFWQPVPTVVTIHDILPWKTLEQENVRPRHAGWYFDKLIPRALKGVEAVITISDQSRKDILSLWPHLESRLHVIRHGIGQPYLEASASPLPQELRAMQVRPPYFVYIGGTAIHKRLDWALRMIRSLHEQDHSPWQLVVCGVEKEAQAAARRTVSESVGARVVFLPFVAEAHMPSLLQNAIGVLYPTLYEGFGLPVLESQAVGTPVLFSDVGSLRELQGPGTEVLPPNDTHAWVATCRRLLEQRAESPSPHEPARQWARQFSWERSAQQHLDVYRLAAAKVSQSPAAVTEADHA